MSAFLCSSLLTETPIAAALSRMMGVMMLMVRRGAGRRLKLGLFLCILGAGSAPALAQVDYSVHFEMEKPKYLLGEPIFCRFVIRNTGSNTFAFRYRTPTRNLGVDYDQEPRFVVTDPRGPRLPDPGPRPCGSPQGTAVYGSVTLPPGQVHTERWLLDQWAKFAAPGRYHVRAERRLALLLTDAQAGKFSEKPVAFALAMDELSVLVLKSTPAQVEEAFQPYLAAARDPKNPNPAEAVVVLTSLPQPFFLEQLVAMAKAGKPDRWDRRDVLDGLARLDTPASWKAILKVFQEPAAAGSGSKDSGGASGGSPALLCLAPAGGESRPGVYSHSRRDARQECRTNAGRHPAGPGILSRPASLPAAFRQPALCPGDGPDERHSRFEEPGHQGSDPRPARRPQRPGSAGSTGGEFCPGRIDRPQGCRFRQSLARRVRAHGERLARLVARTRRQLLSSTACRLPRLVIRPFLVNVDCCRCVPRANGCPGALHAKHGQMHTSSHPGI